MKIFLKMLILSTLAFCATLSANAQNSAKSKATNPLQQDPQHTFFQQNPQSAPDENKQNNETKIALKLKWHLGRQRLHYSKAKLRKTAKIAGREVSTSYFSDTKLTEKIQKVSDKYAIARWTFKWFKRVAVSANGQKITVDTDDITKSNDKTRYLVFSSFIDSSLDFTLAQNAQIKKITGIDKLVERVLISLLGANFKQHPKKAEVEKSIRASLNEKDLKKSFAEGYFSLPEKPVKLGDTWQSELVVNISEVGDVAFKLTYKLEKIKKKDNQNIAVVKMLGKYDNASKQNDISANLVITSSKYEGRFEFDIAQGEFLDYKRILSLETLFNSATSKVEISFREEKSETVSVEKDAHEKK